MTVTSAAVMQQVLLSGQTNGSAFVARMLKCARTLIDVEYEINFDGYPHAPESRGWGKEYPNPDKGLDCSGFGIITEAGGKRMINAREPRVTEENLETSSLFDDVHHYGRVRGMPL